MKKEFWIFALSLTLFFPLSTSQAQEEGKDEIHLKIVKDKDGKTIVKDTLILEPFGKDSIDLGDGIWFYPQAKNGHVVFLEEGEDGKNLIRIHAKENGDTKESLRSVIISSGGDGDWMKKIEAFSLQKGNIVISGDSLETDSWTISDEDTESLLSVMSNIHILKKPGNRSQSYVISTPGSSGKVYQFFSEEGDEFVVSSSARASGWEMVERKTDEEGNEIVVLKRKPKDKKKEKV